MLFGNEATANLEFKIQFVYYLWDVQCVYVCMHVDFPVIFFVPEMVNKVEYILI